MKSESSDQELWSEIDRLRGTKPVESPDAGIGPVAFYWRVSTEDRQSPEDSRQRQLQRAQALISPLGGTIVEEYRDVGVSRSMPWTNRPGANQLLKDLRPQSQRTWKHLVIGEGDRAFYGDQFSQVWPRFEAAGVDIYMPEIGGRFDPSQPLSKTMMSVQGAMSEAEIAQVRRRVRETMAALVIHEGRHMGGRPPYGYTTVNSDEPHPNPKFAAEGRFKRILVVDGEAADVVRRIFALYIDGMGQRSIAITLNRDSIPCPSARHPEQNRHRLQDGWQSSTIEAILRNDKYTGYYPTGEHLSGHVPFSIRTTRASAGSLSTGAPTMTPNECGLALRRMSRSFRCTSSLKLKPSERRRTASRRRRRTQRRLRPTRRTWLSFAVSSVARSVDARCTYTGRERRDPGTSAGRVTSLLVRPRTPTHPVTVNVREDTLKECVRAELLKLFAPANRDQTLRALIDSQEPPIVDELRRRREQKDIADAQRDARNLVEAVTKSGGSRMLLDALERA